MGEEMIDCGEFGKISLDTIMEGSFTSSGPWGIEYNMPQFLRDLINTRRREMWKEEKKISDKKIGINSRKIGNIYKQIRCLDRLSKADDEINEIENMITNLIEKEMKKHGKKRK